MTANKILRRPPRRAPQNDIGHIRVLADPETRHAASLRAGYRGKFRAGSLVRTLLGSFAALRMTTKVDKCKFLFRFPVIPANLNLHASASETIETSEKI